MKVRVENIEAITEYANHGRVVVFDTETTGMYEGDEICQIAAAEYVNGKLRRTMNVYMCPTCEIRQEAADAHGLTVEFLKEHGREQSDAMREFFDFVGKDALLVAHNIRFDLRMVAQECEKFGIENPLGEVETCDTWPLAKYFHPEFKCCALWALLEQLQVEGDNSHNAIDDVTACANVFFKLIKERL